MRDISRSAAACMAAAILGIAFLGTPARAADPPGTPGSADRAQRQARLRSAAAVQRRHVHELMALPDVVGAGTALGADGEPLIRVLTARRRADLPAQLEGVRVEGRVSGRIYALRGPTCETTGDGACATFERWPLPVPIGVSVGHPAITAGTIGARVTDGAQVFALSNNHVLANINQGAIGDAALQPGTFDGGSVAAGDSIGTLDDFEPIRFCEVPFPFPSCSQTNFFDAAIALSSEAALGFATPAGQLGSAPGYGAPNPSIHPAYGDPAVLGDESPGQLLSAAVQKHGRTTGRTTGAIDTIGLTVDVCYDESCNQVARFVEQMAVSGSFSAGGDSGSLVVTDDAFRYPVALLFAGSETQTIVSPIDRVLLRFGVAIDDGGTTVPLTDAAVTGLAVPGFALVGRANAVAVTVRNLGTEPLPAFDVVFADTTEATTAVLAAPALAPGAAAHLDFAWTPAQTGPHLLRASHAFADDVPGNDAATLPVDVLLEPPPVALQRWSGTASTSAWTHVDLAVDYGNDMVVVCTPRYDVDALGPMIARVRSAAGTSFDVGLGRPWFGALPGDHGAAEVDCIVVRAGVYDRLDHGVKMEAVRISSFAGQDGAGVWVGQPRSYAQSYNRPVVLGQVISAGAGIPGRIGASSAFWARGATAQDPPSPTQLFVGRHVGEDFLDTLPPETLAYVVIEAGAGSIDGVAYEAGVSANVVRGVEDAPPYTVPLYSLTTASGAAASSAGMNDATGGWPILYGVGAVTPAQLGLAIEEDWFIDSERSHAPEQVAYLVFGTRSLQCGLGPEPALVLPILGALRRALGRRRAKARA